MKFSSLVPTLIKRLFKKQILKINEIFLVRKKEFCLNFFMVESLLFIGAGAGAGEKNTRSRSRSKIYRLRNTGCGSVESYFRRVEEDWAQLRAIGELCTV